MRRIKWRGFELPTRVTYEEETRTATYAKFIAEPFERGYGTTIGNSLRRVLLSSLAGAAVTAVKIDGVHHEFSNIPGVIEDVTDIILNIKKLRLRIHSDSEKILIVEATQEGEVTGADIQADPEVEIANPDLRIATLSEETEFRLEMVARKGRGYVTAEENTPAEQEVGRISIDSFFSPVTKVSYAAENTRVGQMTNYDKLILEIWTDGSISPEMALVEASKVLRKHYDPFVHYPELGEPIDAPQIPEPEEAEAEAESPELKQVLDLSLEELSLSVRATNCLEVENIRTIRQLVTKTEADLLKLRNLGKTSLLDVKDKLSAHNLELGMLQRDETS